MRRSLTYFWRMNLAVAAGAAVAAAVLTGALLVGDSVRASLREITLERLGGIDHALAGQRFVGATLVERLAAAADGDDFVSLAPAILLQGSAEHADTGARAAAVNLSGVDGRFLELFGGEVAARVGVLLGQGSGSIFPPVVLNQALAEELGAEPGDAILISLKRWSAVPRGSLLGRKDTGNVIERLRLTLAGVVDDRGLGAFGLVAHQSLPHNAFVPLAALQEALDQPASINSVVVDAAEHATDLGAAQRLDDLLRETLEPADLGLTIEPRPPGDGSYVAIESSELVLKPALGETLFALAREHDAEVLPVLTYLANRIRIGERDIPYSTVSALDLSALGSASEFGELRLIDGSPAPALAGDEILLNAVTAEELDAEIGDAVELTYFVVGPREELYEESHTFRLRGIVALEGLGADPTLAQEVPGIADAENMADWNPPFPLDLGRVRSSDEAYWDRFRATPRAFVALAAGQRLWRSRWGELTSVRLAPAEGRTAQQLASTLQREIPRRLAPSAFGLSFQPVKHFGLQAASGATDFSGLFLAFSQFLIVSAALLAALLFSLGVEQRAGEIGLRLALGFPPRRVRRMLLAEGAVLAVLGSLAGLFGAALYAGLMMAALRTWWREAVGTSRLELALTPGSLALGFILSVAVILFAIHRAVRRVGRVSAVALLARDTEPAATRAGRLARALAIGASSLAVGLLLYALVSGESENPALYFVIGPATLVAALAFFSLRLGRPARRPIRGPWRLALSQCGRHRGRSLLAVALVAVACFMIVTVAAYRQDHHRISLDRSSGSGGFSLVAESDIELHQELGNGEGGFELGLSEETRELLGATTVLPFKLRPGEDTSCLNLYQPSEPRLLGVPDELIERGGFTFRQTLEPRDNPWTLLLEEPEPGVVPVIGDINSTMWILKLKLGEDLIVEDEDGEPLRLRLVATLDTSLFQSELLIPERAFSRHFPSRSGVSYFLLETPPENARALAQALESDLASYGFDALPAGDKLAAFHAVQNTYLSTFQTLGGLGLLLGTLGLAVILVRNVLERRTELATLRAFGFRRSLLTRMVIVENAFLLLSGLVIGTVSALLAVAPHLLDAAAQVPWGALLTTLGAIFVFGLIGCALAAGLMLRSPLLPALKAE